jgi:hypothetical protein
MIWISPAREPCPAVATVRSWHAASSRRRPSTDHDSKRLRWRYVLSVAEDPITEELKLAQLEREEAERRRARSVPEEDEAAQHDRRADKARYLAEKLEERAESERQKDD